MRSAFSLSPSRHALALAAAASLAGPATAQSPSPLPPAQIDESLAIEGEEIDARKLKTRMTVNVLIDGTGPYRFVVDSGADTSVVGERIAATLALPRQPGALLHGVTESRMVPRVRVETLTLGSTEAFGLDVPVLAEAAIGADGIVGLDALVEQRMVLDFERRTITVDDGTARVPAYDGEIVVRARLRKGQLILTQVRADSIALDAIVDTGAEVTIGNRALRERVRERLLAKARGKPATVRVIGVTGVPMDLELVLVKRLKIGTVTLTNVPVAFADVPPFAVFGLEDRPALLLGTDLMEVFRRVSLDFRGRKVRFQLRRCASSVRLATADWAHSTRLSADQASACAR